MAIPIRRSESRRVPEEPGPDPGMSADTESMLLIFARAPVPGEVKRRLVPHYGPEGATALYRRLLRGTAEVAAGAGYDEVILCCTPHCAHPELQELARVRGWGMLAQSGADLGERMYRALSTALALAPQAVLIGSDSPSLSCGDLVAAREALAGGADAVFTPAEDGGYLLAGFRDRVPPALFPDIAWGTSRVWRQTRERLMHLSLEWKELPRRWDVDRPDDVLRWQQESGFSVPAAGASCCACGRDG